MAFADTGHAIGAVSQLLQSYLILRLGGTVSNIRVGRPEATGTGITNPRLNLFLYEVQFEPSLRNQSLDEGQPAPLWLVLKYVLTAFDLQGESDSINAHHLLGEGIRALQEMSFLRLRSTLGSEILAPLQDNPEELKVTFDETSADLISKLMQGPDEKYRCSIGFEVRPVMIVTSEPSSYSLLVGIDYTQTETVTEGGSTYTRNLVIGEAGIQIPVLPSLGPMLTRVTPEKFEAGAALNLEGTGLDATGLVVRLGTTPLTILNRTPTLVQCQVDGAISDGSTLSAGSLPLIVEQPLPGGRLRSSNLLIANLLPRLESATAVAPSPSEMAEGIVLNVNLTGRLLGKERDDGVVALYQDGQTKYQTDDVIIPVIPEPPPLQTNRRARFRSPQPIPAGSYRVILRVNGQQATTSLEVNVP